MRLLAASPAPLATQELQQKIMQQVMQPTLAAMQQLGTPYVGFLYAGLMITPSGEVKVLEFNCRMGDPETQPILFRLQSDLVELCLNALKGELNKTKIKWDPRPALAVVIAAGGYPLSYNKGDVIHGLNTITDNNCKIFHAGTKSTNNEIVTNGGRVLAVTALGDDIAQAQTKAYENVKKICWVDCYYRKDIGDKAMKGAE